MLDKPNKHLAERVSGLEAAVKEIEEALVETIVDTIKSEKPEKPEKPEKGDKGDEGLSAYEIWLAAGRTGSKAAFLRSLEGKPGVNGITTTIIKEVPVRPLIGDKGDKGEDAPVIVKFTKNESEELVTHFNNGEIITGPKLPRGEKGEVVEYTRNGGGTPLLDPGQVGRLVVSSTVEDTDSLPILRNGQLLRVAKSLLSGGSSSSSEIINIFDAPYSADETGVNDGSVILQSAIDALDTLGGGVISWNGGYLKVANQTTVKKHVALRGWADDRIPMRQATADSDGISGGIPRTSLKITHGTAGLTTAASATFVLNNNTAGVSNSLIAYPDQLTAGAAPTTYSPLFGVNGTIGWSLKNLQVLNATTILKTEGLGGHAVIENITATPFGGKLFHLDRLAEATFIKDINIWKFGGTATATNDLATYNNANTTVFYLGFVDALQIQNVGTYNVKTTFHLYNNGSGAPWVNINNFHCDNNVNAIVIDDVNIANFSNGVVLGDNELSYDGSCPIDITSNVSIGHARANFSNIDFYSTSHCIHIGASLGEFNFTNITVKTFLDQAGAARYQSNAVRGAAIIDEGNGALVHLTNVSRGGRRQWEHIFGSGSTLTVDGIILPNKGTDISSEITGWDDKAGWSGTTTNLTNTAGGIIFDMLTTANEVTYPLGSLISNEGIGVIEVILNQTFGQAIDSGAEFGISIIDGSGNEITRMWDSNFVPNYQKGYKFIWPFFCDPNVTTNKIKVRFGGLTTGTGSITMTGLKVYRPDRHYITQDFIDSVYGTERFATTRGKVVSMQNNNKIMLANQAPTSGSWIVGDKIYYKAPATNSSIGKVCIAAGTPGTWANFSPVGNYVIGVDIQAYSAYDYTNSFLLMGG